MFERVRKPWRNHDIRKYINYAIFGFICLLFVFIGNMYNTNGVSGAGTAATVNDVVIPTRDFNDQVRQYENREGPQHGLSAAQRQDDDKRIRKNALQHLVQTELLYQAAITADIFPTVAATRDLIVNIPAFQNNGRFDRDYYNQFLTSQQLSAPEFESKVERDVVINQVSDLVLNTWAPPKLVSDLSTEARDTKVSFDYVKADTGALAAAQVSDQEITDFLAKPENKARVKADYQSHQADYQPKEQVRARHILLTGTDALKKIADLKKKLTVKNFAEMAKKYSIDPGSKNKGGELGYFTRDQMDPDFANAAFSAKKGQIVGPIKSQFGYHLILVEDHKTTPAKPYSEVEREIAKQMVADTKKDQIADEFTKAIKAKAGLDAVLAKYHLKWQDGGEVSPSDPYVSKLGLGDEAVVALLSTPMGQVYNDIVRSGSVVYLLKPTKITSSKDDSKENTLDAGMSPYLRYQTGEEILGLWVDSLAKRSRIQTNDMLLK